SSDPEVWCDTILRILVRSIRISVLFILGLGILTNKKGRANFIALPKDHLMA
ncbi:MAG: hypothetical protein ACI9ZD_002603, partial [Paracoccaceae bacterium]